MSGEMDESWADHKMNTILNKLKELNGCLDCLFKETPPDKQPCVSCIEQSNHYIFYIQDLDIANKEDVNKFIRELNKIKSD